MMDTDEAVRRFLDGEEEAFEQIVRLWDTKVFNLAWRFLGNREDAQDVVQDTFLSVFRSIRTLREPRSFSTWLYRIALNHCRSRWRSQSHDISIDEPIEDSRGNRQPPVAERLRVAGEGDTIEMLDLLTKALTGVSEDHRTAVILKEYVGLNLEELAWVMDCPLSTAKSRLYHGLRGVQRNLKRFGVRMSAGSSSE